VCDLQTTGFVAPNAVSIAQAYFEPRAWFRAIYADEEPVGFLMLYDDPDDPGGPRYYLWRLMIAAAHQRKGYGRQALQLLVKHVQGRPGATYLGTSCFPASGGGPERFYRSFGFEPTGEVIDDEIVLRLPLKTAR
jgi:diamine N-acetyltransferase